MDGKVDMVQRSLSSNIFSLYNTFLKQNFSTSMGSTPTHVLMPSKSIFLA
jgi:hypothetical protein